MRSLYTVQETRTALRNRRHARMAERIEKAYANVFTLVAVVVLLVVVTR